MYVSVLACWLGGMAHAAPPRLVVVVSIDQFPREYLDRFEPLFGDGGFRRLLRHGADFPNCHHGHFTTSTGPGHAVMLTGAYPVHNGLISNRWYSRIARARASSVEDMRFPLLGPAGATVEHAGRPGASPLALLAPTVGDGLRAATGSRARALSIAVKDDAAVLMGGWRPNAAYWFDPHTCHFVTSAYYADRLPDWVVEFNAGEPCAPYIGGEWTKLRPDIDYARLADADDVPYERDVYGLGRAFPHPVKEWLEPAAAATNAHGDRYAPVLGTPFGNELLLRFAEAAVAAEGLGSDPVPDILTLSFSSNDYVGHLYGPHSQEVLDMTLRTDRLLADFLSFLDRKVGRRRWLLALTSDHGVAPIPEYLERHGILPARADHYRFSTVQARQQVERALTERLFGAQPPPEDFPGFFESWGPTTEPFIYVNRHAVHRLPQRIPFDALLAVMRAEIERLDGVARVYTSAERAALAASRDPFEQSAYRSWHGQTAGDLLIQLHPYWQIAHPRFATGHGTPYRYDSHVPMLLHGPGIRAGRFERPVAVVDLAPTLSRILGLTPPARSEGQPLPEALE